MPPWRAAFLSVFIGLTGCHFDPAELEGSPAPCLPGYTEIRGFCYSTDAGNVRLDVGPDTEGDVGRPDVVGPDVGSPDVPVLPVLDSGPRPDVAAGCRCDGTRLIDCDQCQGGEYLSCAEDGSVRVGPACLDSRTLATCDGDREVEVGCPDACAALPVAGCEFDEAYGTSAPNTPLPDLRGGTLLVNTSEGVAALDGTPVPAEMVGDATSLTLYVGSVDVAAVSVVGARALGIVAQSTIRITGDIDASANGRNPGPGGFEMLGRESDCPGSDGIAGEGPGGGGGPGGLVTRSGAGGGGYGSRGGNGGGLSSSCGRGGGPIPASFFGGSSGGGTVRASGGGGGGAVFLSARVSVEVIGIIDVSGGGGEEARRSAGAGGGAGGLIHIEAPFLFLDAAALGANGGGGSGGDGEAGADGDPENAPADGGASGRGGEGGAGSDSRGRASDGEGAGPVGDSGGGGGGAGFITLRSADDAETLVQALPSPRWEPLR